MIYGGLVWLETHSCQPIRYPARLSGLIRPPSLLGGKAGPTEGSILCLLGPPPDPQTPLWPPQGSEVAEGLGGLNPDRRKGGLSQGMSQVLGGLDGGELDMGGPRGEAAAIQTVTASLRPLHIIIFTLLKCN